MSEFKGQIYYWREGRGSLFASHIPLNRKFYNEGWSFSGERRFSVSGVSRSARGEDGWIEILGTQERQGIKKACFFCATFLYKRKVAFQGGGAVFSF
jgi:hypothetical protein